VRHTGKIKSIAVTKVSTLQSLGKKQCIRIEENNDMMRFSSILFFFVVFLIFCFTAIVFHTVENNC